MSQILDGLWQCGAFEIIEEANEVKPDLIVCLTHGHSYGLDEKSAWVSSRYIRFPFDDGDEMPNLDALWSIVYEIVRLVKDGKRVIVHCNAGLNRSGLVSAMVVALVTGKTGRQAIEHVRICRKFALLNRTFTNFLEKLG